MTGLKAEYDKLAELYTITGEDWDMEIHVGLTEPVVPVVRIAPEGSNMSRYTVHRDTVEEAVKVAVDMVYREVILGEPIRPEVPYTNPDDHKDPPPWMPPGEGEKE